MEEESKSSGFIVKDKRRFSSEGNFQGEVSEEASTKPSTPISAPQEASSQSTPKSDPQVVTSKSKVPQEPTASDVQFHSLVVSLATQALVLLGEAPGPDVMQIDQDLQAAKQTIDMLLMLQEKTRGNIRDEEDRLLTEILRELQMSFVRATQK